MELYKQSIIQRIRKTLGLTLDEYSLEIKISKTALFLYEHRESMPAFQVMKKIIEHAKKHDIKVTLDELVNDYPDNEAVDNNKK
jgi:transcriptional regulator with XRE-family HTH domain